MQSQTTTANSSPITEIVSMSVNPAFKLAAGRFEKARRIVELQKGFHRQLYGHAIEDNQLVNWFIDWDDYESYQAFTESSDYTSFASLIKSIVTKPVSRMHVPSVPYPAPEAVEGPVVEVSLMDLKAGYDKELFITGLLNIINTASAQSGCMGGSCGYPRGEENSAIALISWVSKEAHMEFRKTPLFREVCIPIDPMVLVNTQKHVVIVEP